jgi:dihydrofolate synthase/folylpolyglutamate synthase
LPAASITDPDSGAASGGVDWLAGLSPWPRDGFGLGRMRALLRALGDPQARFPAVHVVGTNGKSTATRTIEAVLRREGLLVGATVSPHVRRWSERITVDGEEIDLDAAVERVRAPAERLGATQFETLVATALATFADRRVDVAVVEAGLGGRLDATNVLHTRVVLLTNVGLDHTDVLGSTVAEIAREKLAVAHVDSVVVLPDNSFAELVPGRRCVVGGAHAAAEAFVGRPLEAAPAVELPGRLERRPDEIRDGAHNVDGVRWLTARLPPADYTICASILRDKDVDGMLGALAGVGSRFVATTSASTRALTADELADRARARFAHVEAEPAPQVALARAHALGEPVLVTGSLYLLAELEATEAAVGSTSAREP